MMRRRFLLFFPFPKPLPLLDIPDPRYFCLAATSEYATVREMFPRPARLDDGREAFGQVGDQQTIRFVDSPVQQTYTPRPAGLF
jgi:hypothetical protein